MNLLHHVLSGSVIIGLAGCGASTPPEQQAFDAWKQTTPLSLQGQFDSAGQLRVLTAPGASNADAAQMASYPALEELVLSGSELGDEGLAQLPVLQQLKVLKLDGTPVTDAGLAQLAKFPNLEELSLENTGITDTGLQAISGLSHLRLLNLNQTSIRGSGLLHLTALSQLEYLSLQATSLDFSECPGITGWNRMKTLHVARTPVDGEIVHVLAHVPALERLYLDDTSITDQDIPGLARVLAEKTPRLRGLFVDRTRISDGAVESFEPLAKLTELSLLHIVNTEITREGHIRLRQILPEVNLMSTH